MSPEFLQEEPGTPDPTVHAITRVQKAHGPHTRPARAAHKSGLPSVAFKFGGSSVLGAARMLHAAALVGESAKAAKVTVVVSAMKGITDRLLALGRCVNPRAELENIVQLHENTLRELGLDETRS